MVWGCWLGPYAMAHARVYGNPEGALRLLAVVGHHLSTIGVGRMSEILMAIHPTGHGAASPRPGLSRRCCGPGWSSGGWRLVTAGAQQQRRDKRPPAD